MYDAECGRLSFCNLRIFSFYRVYAHCCLTFLSDSRRTLEVFERSAVVYDKASN